MVEVAACLAHEKRIKRLGLFAALSASLMLGACAQVTGGDSGGLLAMVQDQDAGPPQSVAANPQAAAEFYSKAYEKNPTDLAKALAYAQSLNELGDKRQALAVLQQASLIHGSDKRLASAYGRLALELDQVSVAKKMLEVADDPANPDWRVIMARGTASAKEGQYREATGYYERALALAPDHPSVLSNLALAYTMSGDAAKGEALLRRASTGDNVNPKVRQNLALVLGLQGKYDEAQKVGSMDMPPAMAQENTNLVRNIVKLEPKASAPAALPADAWSTEVTETPAQAAGGAATFQKTAAPGAKAPVVTTVAVVRPASE